MDRRTKFILLVIGSLLLLGVVFWFVVWPLLSPVLPLSKKAQPPPLGEPAPPSVNIDGGEGAPQQGESGVQPAGSVMFTPPASDPQVQQILALSRRAGVLSERIGSGSSENGFQNYADAALVVSSALATKLRRMQSDLIAAHPAAGPAYVTIARRLVEIPENISVIEGDTFTVRVQMQVQVQDGTDRRTEYLQSVVTFRLDGANWLESDYEASPFTP